MKRHSFFSILVFSIVFFVQSSAQVYPPQEPLVYHQLSNTPKPAYLSPITDPVFGTTVMRVTDRAVFDTHNTNLRTWHKYAKNQPWNSNGTLIHMDGWPGAILDAQTYQVVNTMTPPGGPNTWSNTQPNIMYGTNHGGFGQNCIIQLDVNTGTYSTVNCFSEYDTISYGKWEGNMSADDRYMALQCRKPDGAMEIACYDFVTNAIISTLPAPVWPDNVAMSQSGQYIIVQWVVEGTGAGQGTWAYNSSDMSPVRNLSVRGGIHFDYGYDTDGNEVIVGHVSYSRDLQMRRIDNGVITSLLSESQMGYAIHVSCRNLNRPGYAYISEFAEWYAVPTNPYYQKVFSVKLDPAANGNALTETFAQPHHSTNVAYDRSTFGVPNRDGSIVMFRSDWEGNANSEINSYVAFMPGGDCNLSCTATQTVQLDCGNNNGQARANPTGGTAPYNYQWNNGQTTQTANNLPADTYTVTITDANNCSTSCTVTLIDNNSGGGGGAFANVSTQSSIAWNGGNAYANRPKPTLGVWEQGDVPGTEIMRVSDDSGNGLHFYNSRQAWNVDMTKLMIGDGVIDDNRLLDATNNYALLPTRIPLNSDRVWSNTNPDLIYGIRGGTQFCVFNVVTGATTVLYTRPGNTQLSLRAKVNIPGDDSKIALYEPSTNRIISYNIQTNAVIAEMVWQYGNINFGGNYVSYDWTGNWIVVGMGDTGKLYRMRPDLTGIIEIHNDVGHSDMAYNTSGESVQVITRGNGSVQVVNIDDPNKFYISPIFGGADPASGVWRWTPDYISGRGQHGNPGWGAFGGEAMAGSPNHPLGLYKIDGNANTATIKVIGFDHHSSAQAASAGGNDDRQKPSVSPDGNQVIFTSDWGVPNGPLSAYIIRGIGGGMPCNVTCSATQSLAPSCGNNNGQASVSAQGGTPPYTYSWTNGQSTPTATGLGAGTYTVTVTDANNSTSTCSVLISNSAAPTCTITETTAPSNGNNNGVATASVQGGNPPYAYSWSNGQSNQTATALSPGTHTVTITDSNNCTTVCSVTMTGVGVICNINVWLEGAYDDSSGNMSNRLQQLNLLPVGQPYSSSPWNYPGNEGSGWQASDYPAGVVDWVLLTLRETPQPDSEVGKGVGLLMQDGSIQNATIELTSSAISSYYIVVEHRNHLPAMSPSAIPLVNNTLTYDFRTTNSYAQGGSGQKKIGNQWFIYAGNIHYASPLGHEITGEDVIPWQVTNGQFGQYMNEDANMDGDVTGYDLIFIGLNNGIFSAVKKSPLSGNCPDSRYITHTVLNLDESSIQLQMETSQNMPLRVMYYPSSNPSQIQYLNCEPTTNYGANGNEHMQTISNLTEGTDYTIIIQSSPDVGANSADCANMIWEDISCPFTLTTEGNCPDDRYITHTVLNLDESSIQLQMETSQNMPLRVMYYPSSNPSQIQYLPCEPTAIYGANGNEHLQTISNLAVATDYTIIIQSSPDVGATSADCASMTWEDISCPFTLTTEGNCPDDRYITHTVMSLDDSSIQLRMETSQNMPLRVMYYPNLNPSQIQYLNCEPTANYGANGNEHVQTISNLAASTDYTIIIQSSLDVGATSADCANMAWEDISCPFTLTTLAE